MRFVRRAELRDADAICAVLARAFADYEWTRWTVDGHDHVPRIAALQRLALTELVLPFGEAWVAGDDDAVLSAALWMRPDTAVPPDVFAAIAPQQAQLEGSRHAASVAAEAALEPYRTEEPHYFLGAVGTDPAARRRGLGAAVLAPVCERLAAENAVARLETCGAANVTFYESLGFEVLHEVDLPDGAPTVWVMGAARAIRRAR